MSVDGIILAAGYSERAGGFKPLLDLCGKALLERTVESMSGICERIIVVGGHEFEELSKLTRKLSGVITVRNGHPERGMFASVRVGVAEVAAERFFILPGDQPAVMPATFRGLLAQGGDIVIPRYKGKKGHPVLFDASCKDGILSLPDSGILRTYIHTKSKVRILDVDDPGIGLDVDTAEDYENMIRYYQENILCNSGDKA